MTRWSGLALAVLLLPAAARAQDEPEKLLPGSAQVYLRWDGVEAHRADYAKTALGKMLQGDTGQFIQTVFAQLQENLGALLTVENLLQGLPPEKLKKIQDDAAVAPKLLGLVTDRGFILALELRGLEPPQGQVYLLIPDGGAKPEPLFGTLRLAAALAKEEVKESKVEGRTVSQLQAGPVNVAWWVEGKHAVVVAGTDPAGAMVKRMTAGNDARLNAQPLYKKVAGFNQYRTAARGYVDVPALVKVLGQGNKDVAKLATDLGLDGLKSLTFYSGFDGEAERGLVEIETAGERKGVLRLAAGKPFKLADVPPLPNDVVSWTMTNLDLPVFYDVATQAAENITKLAEPNAVDQVKGFIQQIDDVLGLKLRDDLLANLDGKFVFYNSPAEGPLTLGQTLLFKVKDAAKLQDALDQAVKGAVKASGLDVTVKKKAYHGVEIREVHVRQEGFVFVPSYAIHKGWLVVGYFPQAVQGYVLRAEGKLPAWKPTPEVQALFDRMPKEFVGVSYSDPTPTVKQVLALAPLIGGLFNSSTKDTKFDVGALPNAHEATRHLFPNVAVMTDQGNTLRVESRASLALPFTLTGLDSYGLFVAAAFAFRGF